MTGFQTDRSKQNRERNLKHIFKKCFCTSGSKSNLCFLKGKIKRTFVCRENMLLTELVGCAGVKMRYSNCDFNDYIFFDIFFWTLKKE